MQICSRNAFQNDHDHQRCEHGAKQIQLKMAILKGIDMVKSWPGPGQKYNPLYLAVSTHPVSLCS